ncbi:transporter substrate-binding domain-containing protein [Hahella sp. KA22]|uniref:substrate-binding periplasmic protein n=1 Tax=Hahella sp. KA22 TaxID=1628392 RepID=UPI000FDD42E2|nr:transporter substrate-binding domain-containing protein [Hahella sp. KA22]AZZ93218.1 amino acid ABC transporter substrate-binding protein [Hahella sp. KA22]QAY56592.1 transporter substrate-binding domain-containing protein [Hahella sp. KA22]
MRRRFTRFVLALLWLLIVQGVYAAEMELSFVRICDDAGEWPPYTFYRVENGKKEIAGYAVDVAREILESNHIKYSIELPSWKRCLLEVRKARQFDMLLNASYTEERSKQYLYSLPYYWTHLYFFYLQQRFPEGLGEMEKNLLDTYVIGGLSGYNYTYLEHPGESMDTDSVTYDHLFLKLRSGKVDLITADYEIMQGFAHKGLDLIATPGMQYTPIPNSPPQGYHMMFPRTPEGEYLKALMDAGITKMQKDGRLQEILDSYINPTEQVRGEP